MVQECIVTVTIPGTIIDAEDDVLLKSFIDALKAKGIEGRFVDSILGWGCLNQNWFEFTTNVDTDMDWCNLVSFTPKEWEYWRSMFETGKLLMIIYYKNGDEFEPHN